MSPIQAITNIVLKICTSHKCNESIIVRGFDKAVWLRSLKHALFPELGEAAAAEQQSLQPAAGHGEPEDARRPDRQGDSADGSQTPPAKTEGTSFTAKCNNIGDILLPNCQGSSFLRIVNKRPMSVPRYEFDGLIVSLD